MLARAQGQTLAENVIDQLLRSIRAGAWKPGEYLPSEKAPREELAGAMRGHLGGPNSYRDALACLPAAHLEQEVDG